MIVACAWCGKIKAIDVTTAGMSDGICGECKAKWLEECERDGDRAPRPNPNTKAREE